MSLNVALISSPSMVTSVCDGFFVPQDAIIAAVSTIKILRSVFLFFFLCAKIVQTALINNNNENLSL